MLSGASFSLIAILMLAGVLLDLLLGELQRGHPLVGFGRYANWLEVRLNVRQGRACFISGAIAWFLAVVPVCLFFYGLIAWINLQSPYLEWAAHAGLLYFCLGLRSLRDHCQPIAQALLAGDLALARQLTGRIVSRDTKQSNTTELSRAAVESLLENGNDAVFGTLFWFVIAGGPGALLFRLANTLDAMWGYRTPRFLAFGCVAARIDDVLNWFPARLTALSYLLLGNRRVAWQCWRSQARNWSSPNAGPVMAAGAGALMVSLGGPARYGGTLEMRPLLGQGHEAGPADIARAWKLVMSTTILWCGVMLLASLFILIRTWL